MGGGGGFIAPLVGAIFSSFMGGFGGGQQAPAPPVFNPPPLPPTPEDTSIKDAEKAEKQRRARASGLSSTILTSGLGVEEDPNLAQKTLLGE